MELLPEEQQVFEQIKSIIESEYRDSGFIPMDQPLLDRKEVLLAKAGGETEKQIYELTKGDTELALRFDLTVPLARYVANNYGSLTFPFRRYTIGKVYRGERAQAGRFREFYQCDVDIIGNENLAIGYDAEMPIAIARVFKRLDEEMQTGAVKIRINNRKLFSGITEELGLTDTQSLLGLIDKKEKITAEEFEKSLQELGLGEETLSVITAFLDSSLEKLGQLGISNGVFLEGVSELQTVLNLAKNSGFEPEQFVFDPTIVRGLDYYTGTIFETNLVSYPEFGSVCSGGRYDNLASQYTSRSLPGVGISIGLSRLFDQLLKAGVLQASPNKTASQILIIPLDEQYIVALQTQKLLRESGIVSEINWSTSKLDKRIGYADKLGVPYVMLIGENEVADGLVTLRNMQTGEESKITASEVANAL